MADRYLLESGSPDGYLLEDGSGVYLLDANPASSTLTDNFDDNSQDTAKWTVAQFYNSLTTIGGTLTETNQRVEIAVDAANNRATGYVSANYYSLIGDAIYAKIATAGNAALVTNQEITLDAGKDSNNYFAAQLVGGNLRIKKLLAGVDTYSADTTYSSTTHAWWRLREASGTVFLDTAPSTASNPPVSGDWTNIASIASDSSVGLDRCKLALQHATTGATTSAPNAYFDGFNTAANGAVFAVPRSFGMIIG